MDTTPAFLADKIWTITLISIIFKIVNITWDTKIYVIVWPHLAFLKTHLRLDWCSVSVGMMQKDDLSVKQRIGAAVAVGGESEVTPSGSPVLTGESNLCWAPLRADSLLGLSRKKENEQLELFSCCLSDAKGHVCSFPYGNYTDWLVVLTCLGHVWFLCVLNSSWSLGSMGGGMKCSQDDDRKNKISDWQTKHSCHNMELERMCKNTHQCSSNYSENVNLVPQTIQFVVVVNPKTIFSVTANALENGSDYKHRKAAHQSFALIYRADILFWWRGLIIISDGFTGLEDQLLMV